MIYVDELFEMEATSSAQAKRVGARNGHRWCHMWTSPGNEEALHAIAKSIGMRREWFQDKAGFPHYDLVPGKRELAISKGAIVKPLREFLIERRQAAKGGAA